MALPIIIAVVVAAVFVGGVVYLVTSHYRCCGLGSGLLGCCCRGDFCSVVCSICDADL